MCIFCFDCEPCSCGCRKRIFFKSTWSVLSKPTPTTTKSHSSDSDSELRRKTWWPMPSLTLLRWGGGAMCELNLFLSHTDTKSRHGTRYKHRFLCWQRFSSDFQSISSLTHHYRPRSDRPGFAFDQTERTILSLGKYYTINMKFTLTIIAQLLLASAVAGFSTSSSFAGSSVGVSTANNGAMTMEYIRK